jgi:uncharacterized protein (DUF2252 family)
MRTKKTSSEPSGHGNGHARGHHRSPAERRAEGKALRDTVAREDHGGWKTPKDRRDPVDLLTESNEGRVLDLVPIRHGRMMQSPFAFYRGSAALMAADLARTPNSGIQVQACGDAHLMNFGGFATPERNFVFDVNDLDETLPAPWEWDLKRLTASVVIAGRHIGLRERESALAATAAASSYREQMAEYSVMRALEVWYDKIDLDRLLSHMTSKEARKRTVRRVEKVRAQTAAEHDFPKLVDQRGAVPRIKDNPPLIFHLPESGEAEYKARISDALAHYRESLPEHIRLLYDRFRYCDFAAKVVGVGSVGTACGIALFMAGDDDPLFLQTKEAKASVLEPYAGKSRYADHGQRVVAGQRLMQSASDMFLGWTHTPKTGRHYYMRQLRDMKISAIVEGFDAALLAEYAKMCAWALARAHARSGDAAMISGYIGSSETFDEAVCEFAVDYADQNEQDYKVFVRAVREERIKAIVEG